MGFSFRKSIKAGPVRVNLSKSGIGVSAGIKGARVGVNANGKAYVAGGANGVYYRKELSGETSENTTKNGMYGIYEKSGTNKTMLTGGIVLSVVALFVIFVGFITNIKFLYFFGGFCLLIAIVNFLKYHKQRN